MGGSKWMKSKLGLALRLNSCLQASRMIEDSSTRFSDAALVSPSPAVIHDSERTVASPTPSSCGNSKACEKICAICLVTVKTGHGHAIFTAECSHSFHFRCIASNVKHGKQSCPVCRAKWKEVPFQTSTSNKSPARDEGIGVIGTRLQYGEMFTYIRPLPPPPAETRHTSRSSDRDVYDDDDEVRIEESTSTRVNPVSSYNGDCIGAVEIEAYPEVHSVPKLSCHNNFLVLIHLKAPPACVATVEGTSLSSSVTPIDLVTVLDISGSMSGSKLVLLKRAMGFVIQNLSSSDRLSVITFSSTARRLFPLRKMTDSGKELALLAVNSLNSNGGTNIAEGLEKGFKVMNDRKWKNSVSSMILLSDGQDYYKRSLLPVSMNRNHLSGIRIPVHTFGFGSDHDSVSMHSISEQTGGTFSFIESENVMQDAFAQCLGGLMSVVIQEMKLEVECNNPLLRLTSVKSDEVRDFLVTMDVPVDELSHEMSLLKIRCSYKNPISKNSVTQDSKNDARIKRPESLSEPAMVSIPVDKQRNRIRSAEAIAEAKGAAERGDLASATSILEKCRNELCETVSAKAGDSLILTLISELRETQLRMANRQVYETSGRAYVLSGLSSHSWQRTTTRDQSTDSGGLYRTPGMIDMVNLSQTMSFGDVLPRGKDRSPRSLLPPNHPR